MTRCVSDDATVLTCPVAVLIGCAGVALLMFVVCTYNGRREWLEGEWLSSLFG